MHCRKHIIKHTIQVIKGGIGTRYDSWCVCRDCTTSTARARSLNTVDRRIGTHSLSSTGRETTWSALWPVSRNSTTRRLPKRTPQIRLWRWDIFPFISYFSNTVLISTGLFKKWFTDLTQLGPNFFCGIFFYL